MRKPKRGTKVLFWKSRDGAGYDTTLTVQVGTVGPKTGCSCCIRILFKGELLWVDCIAIITRIPKKASAKQIQALKCLYAKP